MRIIFNAYNLILGGGLSVGQGVMEGLVRGNPQEEIHVFLPKRQLYSFTSSGKLHVHFIPRFFTDYSIGRLLAGGFLSRKARKLNPDRVFSLGNYALSVNCPQLLMLQWPYAVYPESSIWSKMSRADFIKRKLRLFFLKKSLKNASALTVQTGVMKERVKKYLPGFSDKIFVVESSFRKESHPSADSQITSLREKKGEKLLLCMSEYYSHKNLEVLLPLASLIKERKLDYKIIITIDPSLLGASKLLLKINRKGLNNIIINLGRVNPLKANAVYHSCDALLLPTLLESYGISYLEAAHARIPILTSDLDFAHALNGGTAWYFDSLSAESILQTIQKAFSDPFILKEKIDQAFQKASKVRTWEEITKEYLKILKAL